MKAKIEDRRSKIENDGAPHSIFAIRHSLFADRPVAWAPCSDRRRASVLVLVMTLLGILFVVGVAFLASMNFEAGMIAAESDRAHTDSGVHGVLDGVGSTLRDTIMLDASTPFGGLSDALSQIAYAEMPGVHNSFSPIEPFHDPGPTAVLNDDLAVFPWSTDLLALRKRRHANPALQQTIPINTSLFSGSTVVLGPGPTNLKVCTSGSNLCGGCDIDADCPGGRCLGPTIVDTDGDGIVDSVQVELGSPERLGSSPACSALEFLSQAQIASLSARLNPPSNPGGKVFVGVRIIPHTGLVNLNASHPELIRNVFGLQDAAGNPIWPPAGALPDPNLGNFIHRPTQNQAAYSPAQDEPMLRRRVLLPPRLMSASWMQGNPALNIAQAPNAGADMHWQLFAPDGITGAANELFQSAFPDKHRYWSYAPDERYNESDPDSPSAWAVRMDPETSFLYGLDPREYDRRHLVTTVSYDDLLSRGAHVTTNTTPTTPPITDDLLVKMVEANQANRDDNVCPPGIIASLRPPGPFVPILGADGTLAYPFEYPDYPQSITNPPDINGDPCCGTDLGCHTNPRKGRLQLSLAWLDSVFSDDGIDNDVLPRVRRDRLIYDAFMMLVSNARGTYWEDRTCATNADCAPYEHCVPGTPAFPDQVCRDRVTNQPHRQNLITRTAAALTANLLDFADRECLSPGDPRDGQTCRVDGDCPGGGVCQDRGIPTRVALRSFDFERSVCLVDIGFQLFAPVLECRSNADCAALGAGVGCYRAGKAAGREFDTDPALDRFGNPPATDGFTPVYVYGIEKQPYITEVATAITPNGPIEARGIELFNPYDTPLDATSGYYLVEVNPAVGLAGANFVPLNANLEPNTAPPSRPFTVFLDDPTAYLPVGANGQSLPAGTLTFENGWTIYLVRQFQFSPGEPFTNIVLDQFLVDGDAIGLSGAATPASCPATSPSCIYSLQRAVTRVAPWTSPVPKVAQVGPGPTTLGDWNAYVPAPLFHPVEMKFANLGTFSQPIPGLPVTDPKYGSVSFPTTGSLLMLMRHANRSLSELNPPSNNTELAFTARLADQTVIPGTGVTPAPFIDASQLIDNGRMPLFDDYPPVAGNFYAAHHVVPPPVPPGTQGTPGDLNQLPWGQLVFDYFTALPLSNSGPYFVNISAATPGAPESQPRVDLEGLRVHGRINLNAAPAIVLAGLPLIPMQRVPFEFRAEVRNALGLTLLDTEAAPIPFELAQAIVAYRELRPVGGSGNYDTGAVAPRYPLPPFPPPTVAYARGWDDTPARAIARRGTGFMSVGELANVRHLGAELSYLPPALPPLPGFPTSYYRIDGGVIGRVPANNNTENFVNAVAALYALGDWVTVRSQVFTVYGVLRGEDDPILKAELAIAIPPLDPVEQAKKLARDVDSRAIRFQETIDRLPTVLGEPVPSRIGASTISRYTDVRGD